MKKHGIRINDLNSLTDGFPPELFVQPGDVPLQGRGLEENRPSCSWRKSRKLFSL